MNREDCHNANSENDRYRLLVDAITDYAIYMLDPEGIVRSWNPGAERLKGYGADEIIGQHFSRFYTDEERAAGVPDRALKTALAEGRYEERPDDSLRLNGAIILNSVKCLPPQNKPLPDEVATCEPFLFEQIAAIQPKVVVALGKFAAQSLLRTSDPITRLRGREFKYRDAILMPTYHPAYLLRTPSAKRDVWEDMKRVKVLLSEKQEV